MKILCIIKKSERFELKTTSKFNLTLISHIDSYTYSETQGYHCGGEYAFAPFLLHFKHSF